MKRWCIGIAMLLLMMLPMQIGIDDGGTEVYAALLYRVTDWHMMDWREGVFGYHTGIEIRILGIEIYNNVQFIPAQVP